jgi:hypothetical protein
MANDYSNMIGGIICHMQVPPTLIDPEDKFLSPHQRDQLWGIFVEIGRCWRNLPEDSISVKSSWLEFIRAKTENEPSYVGEYANAIAVVQELVRMYGHQEAFSLLFLRNGIPDGAPVTRLAHAKQYVIDEFIRMQIVASGFRGFVKPTSLNYNGFVGGSRYNRLPRARLYTPQADK